MKSKYLKILTIFFLIFCNIGCDQVSKTIVRKQVGYYENISLVADRLTLTRVENTGAFLSVGNTLPSVLKIILLTVVPSAALLYGIYYLITRTRIPKLFLLGACFVIGGGIGNLYDRFRFGSVTDFLHIDFGLFQTGIFNFADVSVMTGMVILLVQIKFQKPREPEPQP